MVQGAVTAALETRPALVSRRLLADLSAFSIDIETNPADGDRIFKLVRSGRTAMRWWRFRPDVCPQGMLSGVSTMWRLAPSYWWATTSDDTTYRSCDGSTQASVS